MDDAVANSAKSSSPSRWEEEWKEGGAVGLAHLQRGQIQRQGSVPESFAIEPFNKWAKAAVIQDLAFGPITLEKDSASSKDPPPTNRVLAVHRRTRPWDEWLAFFLPAKAPLDPESTSSLDSTDCMEIWCHPNGLTASISWEQQLRLRLCIQSFQEGDALKDSTLSTLPASSPSQTDTVLLPKVDEALFILNPEGVFLDCHPAPDFPLMFPKEKIIGKSFRELLPHNLSALLDQALITLREGREPAPFIYHLKQPSGLRLYSARVLHLRPNEVLFLVRHLPGFSELFGELQLEWRALNQINEGVVIAKATDDYPIVFVNSAFASTTGYTPAEVLGHNLRFLQASDNQPEVRAAIRLALQQGQSLSVILRNYHKNGSLYLVDFNLSPVRDAEGHLTHFVAVERDVTELTQARETISWQARLFQSVMDHQQEVLCRLSSNQSLTFVNRAFCRTLSSSEQNLIGTFFLDYLPADQRSLFQEHLRHLIETGSPQRTEHALVRRDGSLVWFDWIDAPVFDSSGSLREIQKVGRDITELRQIIGELKRSNERFNLLCSRFPELIFEMVLDENERLSFRFLSDSVEKVWGVPGRSLLDDGMLFLSLLEEDSRREFLQLLRRSFRQVIPFVFEGRIFSGSTPRWIRISASPCLGDSESAWIGVSADITQKKETERETILSAKREVIEQMAGGIAHDLNNYLAATLGAAQILEQRLADRDDLSPLTKVLIEQIQASASVSRQLLAFTKDQPVQQVPIDVQGLLQRSARFALRGSSVRAEIEANSTELLAIGDPGLLQQVLFNLLLNAREALEGKGRIRLRAEADAPGAGSFIRIHIIDSGPGIPEECAEKIFEPYFTQKEKGTGLGLYVVQVLMNKMKGSIQLLNPGKPGAHFLLTLPAVRSVEKLEVAEPRPDPPGSSLPLKPECSEPYLVILLEDEPALALVIEEFITSQNARIRVFSKGEDLLPFARSLDPTGRLLFLLDVTIPDALGGLEIAGELRNLHPSARIILSSGYADRWSEWQSQMEPLRVEFLSKPYNLSELERILQS
ncbi:MAG: PAS domain S-box protein [Verrucomicrobiia bacterium]